MCASARVCERVSSVRRKQILDIAKWSSSPVALGWISFRVGKQFHIPSYLLCTLYISVVVLCVLCVLASGLDDDDLITITIFSFTSIYFFHSIHPLHLHRSEFRQKGVRDQIQLHHIGSSVWIESQSQYLHMKKGEENEKHIQLIFTRTRTRWRIVFNAHCQCFT